jgi:hypothetical protein
VEVDPVLAEITVYRVYLADPPAPNDTTDLLERRVEVTLITDLEYDPLFGRTLYEVDCVGDVGHHRLLQEDVEVLFYTRFRLLVMERVGRDDHDGVEFVPVFVE